MGRNQCLASARAVALALEALALDPRARDDASTARARSPSDLSLVNELALISEQLAWRTSALDDVNDALKASSRRERAQATALDGARADVAKLTRIVDELKDTSEKEKQSAIDAIRGLSIAMKEIEEGKAQMKRLRSASERDVVRATERAKEDASKTWKLREETFMKTIEELERRRKGLEGEITIEVEKKEDVERRLKACKRRFQTEAAASAERIKAMETELERMKSRESGFEEKISKFQSACETLKTRAEEANARATNETKRLASAMDGVGTLERRIADMRREHIASEREWRHRLEGVMERERASQEDARAEAKEKFAYKAELEDALAKLRVAEEREAHARDSLESVTRSKDLIYKAYLELLAQTQEAEHRVTASSGEGICIDS